jgi:hypothetical protein
LPSLAAVLMEHLLQQLPNGGAVAAIIVVVVLYLKHQERREDKMEVIVKHFLDEIAVSRKDYLDQLDRMGGPKPPRTPRA